jgi:hypothetical protein
MGTDIHSIAQVRRNGSWETVAIGVCGDPRSYNTFAMLADVRNGTGTKWPSRARKLAGFATSKRTLVGCG